MKRLLLPGLCLALYGFDGLTSQTALMVFNPESWGPGPLPSGWQVKVNHGKPDIASIPDDGGVPVLRLRSKSASFGLERNVDVDPERMPFLAWRWKVAKLPPNGDFRRSSTDDQAAQILVAFSDRRILTYIWDSSAPRGMMRSSVSIPLVHIFAVVCRSGPAELNSWVDECHNVAGDYQRAYNRPAPHVKGLRLQINSQHTGTQAESYFGEIAFRKTQL